MVRSGVWATEPAACAQRPTKTRRSRRPAWLIFASLAAAAVLPRAASAWSDHALGAYPALAAIPRVQGSPPVKVESLDDFVAAEQDGLRAVLEQEEVWARENVPAYPPRPEGLDFSPQRDQLNAPVAFLRALRVNPSTNVAPFVERLPGSGAEGRPAIPWQQVTLLKDPGALAQATLVALRPGDTVSALEVLATACGEPDYGLDIGLWEDNGTAYGLIYGFGSQPFGNPKFDFSSQAPFHMGFYHEAWIVYRMAGFLKRSYPEFRIHLFQNLSRYAFQRGHDYWGWRFAGWGLHYIQDLTQPYHSTVLPGVGVSRMLWINTIAMVGFKEAKGNAIQLVSNRHLALERYVYEALREASTKADSPLARALADVSGDAAYGAYTPAHVRRVITRESQGRAAAVDADLERRLPRRMVSDPAYVFDQTEPNVSVMGAVMAGAPAAQSALDELAEKLMRSFGAHSRNFLKSIVN